MDTNTSFSVFAYTNKARDIETAAMDGVFERFTTFKEELTERTGNEITEYTVSISVTASAITD